MWRLAFSIVFPALAFLFFGPDSFTGKDDEVLFPYWVGFLLALHAYLLVLLFVAVFVWLPIETVAARFRLRWLALFLVPVLTAVFAALHCYIDRSRQDVFHQDVLDSLLGGGLIGSLWSASYVVVVGLGRLSPDVWRFRN